MAVCAIRIEQKWAIVENMYACVWWIIAKPVNRLNWGAADSIHHPVRALRNYKQHSAGVAICAFGKMKMKIEQLTPAIGFGTTMYFKNNCVEDELFIMKEWMPSCAKTMQFSCQTVVAAAAVIKTEKKTVLIEKNNRKCCFYLLLFA